jgi:hypothetical protein
MAAGLRQATKVTLNAFSFGVLADRAMILMAATHADGGAVWHSARADFGVRVKVQIE